MLILSEEEHFPSPCVLLLGGFDGIHRGHASLLARAIETGLPVGMMSILGGKAGGELFTRPERRYIFMQAGVAFVTEYAFSDKFRTTPPEAFLRSLFARFDVKAVFCGEDFRFGKDAAGSPDLLGALAPCPVTVLPLAEAGGEKIATSRIKRMVAETDVAGADALLLHPYFVGGTVERGRHVGGPVLGFPTLNLTIPPEKTHPGEGVYAGYAETPAGTYPAIINFGARPTFGVAEKKAEAYLDGFDGDLYGADVRIYPTRFLRPVMKFDCTEQLKAQLQRDIARLRSGT